MSKQSVFGFFSRAFKSSLAIVCKSFHKIKYFILFITILLILNGQPKSIFRTKLHIPWLANVKHVQPLKCISDLNQTDWPRPLLPNTASTQTDSNLTIVIVTARPEFKRLPLTLAALVCHLHPHRITQVLFLVPPQDVYILQPYLSNGTANYWPWPINIISDDILLKHVHAHSYRLQMMFKLFVAQIVSTEHYLILDSDCLAVRPIHVEYLLYENKNLSKYQALYQMEDKSSHAEWWTESEALFKIQLESCVGDSRSRSLPTMGVTPGILSRTISLRTLCRLQKLYGDDKFLNRMANWALWKLLVGGMWTEYTLYYLTGRCTNQFDQYHIHYNTFLSSTSSPKISLTGFSIWSVAQWTPTNKDRLISLIRNGLAWRLKEIQQENGRAIIDNSTDIHSLFSVLQGRHGVDPKHYHELFYPLYMEYLQKNNQRKEMIDILIKISEKLTAL